MAAACLQTAAMPHPLRPETDRSSYTNQPPTWQVHAFRQLPPGLRKPSKEHFLIFHRYSTELFRGWTFLLDFWKLLANTWYATRYSSHIYIYICDFVELFLGFSSKHHMHFGYATRYSSYIYIYMWSRKIKSSKHHMQFGYATRYSSYIYVFLWN